MSNHYSSPSRVIELIALFWFVSLRFADCYSPGKKCISSVVSRRSILKNGLIAFVTGAPLTSNAVERAVGVGEQKCREAGNCLEIGEWDGAVGWQWGGKDRCDPSDPNCMTNGKLRDAPAEVLPLPPFLEGDLAKITDVVQIDVAIGKQAQSETRTLRIGLYGNAFPTLVKQFLDFTSTDQGGGLVSSSPLAFDEGYGVSTAPVSLIVGGLLECIYPERKLEFGVPSQSAAFAKRKGKSKAPEDFMAQPRPKQAMTDDEDKIVVRNHDSAGLISVPRNGIGYANPNAPDDEAFSNSFGIISAADSSLDKKSKVIGQLIDEESMESITRLVALPTRKGITGVIPGQNSGPPLVKVSVRSISISKDVSIS